jgi:hypothetical protein
VDKKQKDLSIGYFILALKLMFLGQYFLFTQSSEPLFYSQFKSVLKHGQITDIVVRDKEICGRDQAGSAQINFYAAKDHDAR